MRMAMMAITTSNSISVKPAGPRRGTCGRGTCANVPPKGRTEKIPIQTTGRIALYGAGRVEPIGISVFSIWPAENEVAATLRGHSPRENIMRTS